MSIYQITRDRIELDIGLRKKQSDEQKRKREETHHSFVTPIDSREKDYFYTYVHINRPSILYIEIFIRSSINLFSESSNCIDHRWIQHPYQR
jgi:hypothetical protein